MRRIVRVLLLSVGVLIALFALGLLVAAVVYTPEYVGRMLAWRNSDYGDYMHNFPMRSLRASSQPYSFAETLQEEEVAGVMASVFGVEDLDAFLEQGGTQALVVIQDDAILYERYFNGVQRDTLLTSFSTAKSFDSALIGIAIAEGHIASVDDPITVYLPELAERDERFSRITIRHLLRMASGLAYQGFRPLVFNSDDILTTYYPDQRRAALQFTRIADLPGQTFLYNKYHPQLLGLILERATGMSVTDFMQQKLWEPLGMEYDGSWSLDSEASGFEKMEAGLNARALDYAKLGRLFLEQGNWNGTQIVPAEWVVESTAPDPATATDAYYRDDTGRFLRESDGYYKYMWWGFRRGETGYDFTALGDHGQLIYVAPHQRLIIVRNGTDYGPPGSDVDSGGDWARAFYRFATEWQQEAGGRSAAD
jgi:CubicO group peptidase (beta-lactamase class C family)